MGGIFGRTGPEGVVAAWRRRLRDGNAELRADGVPVTARLEGDAMHLSAAVGTLPRDDPAIRALLRRALVVADEEGGALSADARGGLVLRGTVRGEDAASDEALGRFLDGAADWHRALRGFGSATTSATSLAAGTMPPPGFEMEFIRP